MKEATNNLIKTSSLNAKIMAMTTAVSEGVKTISTRKTSIVVIKDIGRKLAALPIESRGFKLSLSDDFKDEGNADHSFDVLVIGKSEG